jgi:hypothetical protein
MKYEYDIFLYRLLKPFEGKREIINALHKYNSNETGGGD